MTKKPLSEAAQWFLNDLQKILDDLAESMALNIFVIDREGHLVSKLRGTQKVCQMILATENGKARCQDHFKMALALIKIKKEPIFVECYADFTSFWTPIVVKGKFMGTVISCGGRYDQKYGPGELEAGLVRVGDEIGILARQDFLKAGEQVISVNEQELKSRAKKLEELFALLAKTTTTPLKEVFS